MSDRQLPVYDVGVYERALQHIRTHGWWQGNFFPHSVGLGITPMACVRGALLLAATEDLPFPLSFGPVTEVDRSPTRRALNLGLGGAAHGVHDLACVPLYDCIKEQFPERLADAERQHGQKFSRFKITGPKHKATMVGQFNDHPDTTQADIEMILEKVIVRLYERG